MNLTIYVIYAICFVASAGFLISIFTQQSSDESKSMLGMGFFISISCFGHMMLAQAITPDQFFTCEKIIMSGNCHIYLIMLGFIGRYCHIVIPRPAYYSMAALNCIINAFAITMDTNRIFVNSLEITDRGVFIVHPGLLMYLAFFTNIAYLITIIVFLLKRAIRGEKSKYGRRHHSEQSVLILFAVSVIVPQLAESAHFTRQTTHCYTPVGFVVTELIFMFLMYVIKIYDVNDLERNYIINTMLDGVVIVTKNHRFRACNDIAKEIYPELRKAKKNDHILDISEDLGKILAERTTEHETVHDARTYSIDPRRIKNDSIVIWIKDITEERKARRIVQGWYNELESSVAEKTAKLKKMQKQMIYCFADLVESRDSTTGAHVRRTCEYVTLLAEEMQKRGLYTDILGNSNTIDQMSTAAALHDIGKMVISDSILQKPGKLSDEEFARMKEHTTEGGKIITGIIENIDEIADENYFEIGRDMAIYHHEKWDGSGYPHGKKGVEIPLTARIMAVADFFDALTTERPYKKAYSINKAYSILQEEAGRQFDPEIVDCFNACRPRVEMIIGAENDKLADDNELSERDRVFVNDIKESSH